MSWDETFLSQNFMAADALIKFNFNYLQVTGGHWPLAGWSIPVESCCCIVMSQWVWWAKVVILPFDLVSGNHRTIHDWFYSTFAAGLNHPLLFLCDCENICNGRGTSCHEISTGVDDLEWSRIGWIFQGEENTLMVITGENNNFVMNIYLSKRTNGGKKAILFLY